MCPRHQEPFVACVVLSSKTELSKTHNVLDLSDHRLGNRLTQSIRSPTLEGQEFPLHALLERQGLWDRHAWCSGGHWSMAPSGKGYIGVDLFEPRLFQTLLDFKPVRQYFEDIELAVGIVDDLNLNTRIWSKQ